MLGSKADVAAVVIPGKNRLEKNLTPAARKNSRLSLRSTTSSNDGHVSGPETAHSSSTSLVADVQDQLKILSGPSPGKEAEMKSPPKVDRKFSSSHQRHFHRRFPSVPSDEMLIDWFNCALVTDILVQGYLYISPNFFAFYSNIFGFKTEVLIPVNAVVSVTKEKTARFFPNAVGICTDESKHIFGSLISRETTFKLMTDVWKTFLETIPPISQEDEDSKNDLLMPNILISDLDDTGGPGIQLKTDFTSDDQKTPNLSQDQTGTQITSGDHSDGQRNRSLSSLILKITNVLKSQNISHVWIRVQQIDSQNFLLILTILLVILLFSASYLIIRSNAVYSRLSIMTSDRLPSNHAASSIPDDLVESSNILSSHVRQIFSHLQVKLKEVTQLREELEQVLAFASSISSSHPNST